MEKCIYAAAPNELLVYYFIRMKHQRNKFQARPTEDEEDEEMEEVSAMDVTDLFCAYFV